MSGLSGPAAYAAIHLGAPGKTGKILVHLCAPCSTSASGARTLSNYVIRQMLTGKAYVNVHTNANTRGETRGQIKRTS
jgi:CHRD domain